MKRTACVRRLYVNGGIINTFYLLISHHRRNSHLKSGILVHNCKKLRHVIAECLVLNLIPRFFAKCNCDVIGLYRGIVKVSASLDFLRFAHLCRRDDDG